LRVPEVRLKIASCFNDNGERLRIETPGSAEDRQS